MNNTVYESGQVQLANLETKAYDFLNQEQYDSAYVYGNMLLDEAYKAEDYHGYVISGHICLGYASVHIGNIDEALGHLGQAHSNAASCNNNPAIVKTFTELFDVAEMEHARRVQHQNNLTIAGISLVALVIITGLLTWMYIRKNQLYKAIVRQNHEMLKSKQEKLHKEPSAVRDMKREELVEKLERLMNEQQLYHENLLTRDKVADLLETNRTYLGQIMSEVYQKSFTQYINDLRIDEAISILDNPKNVRAIKLIGLDLGFNSVTTFNTQFQNRTGISPAQYRKKVIEMYQENEGNSQ